MCNDRKEVISSVSPCRFLGFAPGARVELATYGLTVRRSAN